MLLWKVVVPDGHEKKCSPVRNEVDYQTSSCSTRAVAVVVIVEVEAVVPETDHHPLFWFSFFFSLCCYILLSNFVHKFYGP